MPYIGGKLAPWFGRAPAVLAMHRMADAGGRQMTFNVKSFTPIDTSHLMNSIKRRLVVVHVRNGRLEFESGAETDVEYAPYVEHGTGMFGPLHRAYVIRPKRPGGWLRWIDPTTGRPVFAKEVWHQGSPGNHMFSSGVALTEAQFDRIVAPALDRWAHEQERSNPHAR